MRQKKYEITDIKKIQRIIETGKICRLGMCYNNIPYVVPLNYGYKDNELYFHSAAEGMKIDFMKKNNTVCFEIEEYVNIIEAEDACKWTTHYASVIGWGKVQFITESNEKKRALDILMHHHSGKSGWKYKEKDFGEVCMFKVSIEKAEGKSRH